MKRYLMLAAVALLFSQLTSAAPCTSGSLATYVGLGAGGCTIGTNTVLNFQIVSGTTGATAISPLAVSLAPFNGVGPGLSTMVNTTATAGTINELLFTYQLTGNSYTGSILTLGGASETGDGAVTAVQNFCAGGTFGPSGVSGCTGTPGALVAVDGAQNQDSSMFMGVSLLSVTNDFTVDGGTSGSASGGTFTNQFPATAAAIPEPADFLLTAIGLALAAGWRFKSSSRMS